jgi:hypothetical protein
LWITMKLLPEVIAEQRAEVEHYRSCAAKFAEHAASDIPGVIGVLLSGSASRGDARLGPHGFLVDIVIVHDASVAIDPVVAFGPGTEPDLPFHCVEFDGLGFALEFATLEQLRSVRAQPESVIFARNESVVLADPTGELARWKATAFAITEQQMRDRAMAQFWRYQYLVGAYRIEKWAHRQAWIQIGQLLNEACECYCFFLHSVNGTFMPRKDWLPYLTFELPIRPKDHDDIVRAMYGAGNTEAVLGMRLAAFLRAGTWMGETCQERGWQ